MKVVVALGMVMVMVMVVVEHGQAVTCGQVDSALASCVQYLTKGGSPAPDCCNGVRNLKSMTPTPLDRRAACNCIKQVAARYQNIREDAATQLPAKCGVQVNVPIKKDVDCTKIS